MSRESIRAPADSNSSAKPASSACRQSGSVQRLTAAASRAVYPLGPRNSVFAPSSNNVRTSRQRPSSAATINGVGPLGVARALGSAPLSTSCLASLLSNADGKPVRASCNSGLLPNPLVLGSAPARNSAATICSRALACSLPMEKK